MCMIQQVACIPSAAAAVSRLGSEYQMVVTIHINFCLRCLNYGARALNLTRPASQTLFRTDGKMC